MTRLRTALTAAATAIQWLGSSVGFSWLKETLDGAGYVVEPKPAARKGRK